MVLTRPLRWSSSILKGKVGKKADHIKPFIWQETMPMFVFRIESGLWVGECFLFISSTTNKLAYAIGGCICSLAHLPSSSNKILKYLVKTERVYLADRDCSVYSYYLPLVLLQIQVAVMGDDMDEARRLFPLVPSSVKDSLALFLRERNYLDDALHMTTNINEKFSLSLKLGNMDMAVELAESSDVVSWWEAISVAALKEWNVALAMKAMKKCPQYSQDLLLMNALLGKGIDNEDEGKGPKRGPSFFLTFVNGRKEDAFRLLVSKERYAEAAMFSRAWLGPMQTTEAVELWQRDIRSKKASWSDFSSQIVSPKEDPDKFNWISGDAFESIDAFHYDHPLRGAKNAPNPDACPFDIAKENDGSTKDELSEKKDSTDGAIGGPSSFDFFHTSDDDRNELEMSATLEKIGKMSLEESKKNMEDAAWDVASLSSSQTASDTCEFEERTASSPSENLSKFELIEAFSSLASKSPELFADDWSVNLKEHENRGEPLEQDWNLENEQTPAVHKSVDKFENQTFHHDASSSFSIGSYGDGSFDDFDENGWDRSTLHVLSVIPAINIGNILPMLGSPVFLVFEKLFLGQGRGLQ